MRHLGVRTKESHLRRLEQQTFKKARLKVVVGEFHCRSLRENFILGAVLSLGQRLSCTCWRRRGPGVRGLMVHNRGGNADPPIAQQCPTFNSVHTVDDDRYALKVLQGTVLREFLKKERLAAETSVACNTCMRQVGLGRGGRHSFHAG